MAKTVPPGGIAHYAARSLHLMLKGANKEWARDFSSQGDAFDFKTRAFHYQLLFTDELGNSNLSGGKIHLDVYNLRDDSLRGIQPLYGSLLEARSFDHKDPRWLGVRNQDREVLAGYTLRPMSGGRFKKELLPNMGVDVQLTPEHLRLSVTPLYRNNSQGRVQDLDTLTTAVLRSMAKPAASAITELPR